MNTDLTFSVASREDNPAFEARTADGKLAAELVFHQRGSTYVFLHTGVEDDYQGHGLAGEIAQYGFEYVQEQGGRVKPNCPFIRDTFLPEHPEWQELAVESA
ncbi:GNAT family N-acetyltransferase [Arthrobacter sp. UM1]|uniref:GNAT family N-acetyltransferase n=1 Tax=Arthrobacter sp. UM1 TaxID=2766776 RepID=UPI001CF686B5|nr:GNAT family N-acetyltransferase [Arthrobacter sp. UM1]MCB4208812.1 N-acetyltransferase [Arthrobacter sp. UM1]